MSPNFLSGASRQVIKTTVAVGILVFGFAGYVFTEKQIDRANAQRELSGALSLELRRSSDELTRMARTYVVTGDGIYKVYFQDIIAIRDGDIPAPPEYDAGYWDMVLAGKHQPPARTGRGVGLLERMRSENFTAAELSMLTQSKESSDALAVIEQDAMRLAQMQAPGQEAPSEHRRRAISLLNDAAYHQHKARIMGAIAEFSESVDARTRRDVERWVTIAFAVRLLVIACGLWVIYLLVQSYRSILSILGAPAEAIHAAIRRIGQGRLEPPIVVPDGKAASVMGELAEMQRKLRQHQEERQRNEVDLRLLAATFEAHEAIVITDARSSIIRVNRAFERITGYPAHEVLGQNPRMLSSGQHDEAFYAQMWAEINAKGTWSGELWDRHKLGHIYPKQVTISAVRGGTGAVEQYVAIFTDISERKQAESEIHNLAYYDALTRLPNRRLLMDSLAKAIAMAQRSKRHGALMFLDLDNFKVLNDTQGHDYGDLLLIEVAGRLKRCTREVDMVARMGGDEFVVLVEDLAHEEAEATQLAAHIAEKVRVSLAAPYQLKEHLHHSSPSIGVSLFCGSDPAEELIKRADVAMYCAKDSGRNRVRFYDPRLQASVEARATLENDLREAVAARQFTLFYQAQVDETGRTTGAEALIRWAHPERGMVSPVQFIPVAEESGMIIEIGDWVLETACRQLAAWSTSEATRNLTLSINVSARQFKRAEFVEMVNSQLIAHGVEPSRLKLELTESVALGDMDMIIAKILALRHVIGVSLALDDFGTGYSSLAYLKRLTLDQVKIDQSFVRGMTTEPSDAVMVKTIIDLASNFGMESLAEGVETREHETLLKSYGCRAFQGYLFGRPMPIEAFEARLATESGSKTNGGVLPPPHRDA